MDIWVVTQSLGNWEGDEPAAVFSREEDAENYKNQDIWNRDIFKLSLDGELS